MGLFDGIISELETKASGVLASAESAIGIVPAPAGAPPALKATGVTSSKLADLQSKAAQINRWRLVLDSQDKSMNAKDGAANLREAVKVWTQQTSQRALDSIAAASGSLSDDAIAQANADYSSADDYAQKIVAAIQKKWAEFAAEGTPGVLDYVAAPVSGIPDAARAVTATATKAAARVEQLGADVADKTALYLKIGGVTVVGLVAYLIYTAGQVAPALAPHVARAYIPNGSRRRRSRRRGRR